MLSRVQQEGFPSDFSQAQILLAAIFLVCENLTWEHVIACYSILKSMIARSTKSPYIHSMLPLCVSLYPVYPWFPHYQSNFQDFSYIKASFLKTPDFSWLPGPVVPCSYLLLLLLPLFLQLQLVGLLLLYLQEGRCATAAATTTTSQHPGMNGLGRNTANTNHTTS